MSIATIRKRMEKATRPIENVMQLDECKIEAAGLMPDLAALLEVAEAARHVVHPDRAADPMTDAMIREDALIAALAKLEEEGMKRKQIRSNIKQAQAFSTEDLALIVLQFNPPMKLVEAISKWAYKNGAYVVLPYPPMPAWGRKKVKP